ncbi:MAG: TRAP transporter small permease [Desulfobacteraceae bacterium]|nr:TRAP transporter small permease [Desulfobacteraceae bacterium]
MADTNRLEIFSNRLNQWVERLVFVLGLAMAIIVVLQVFARYVLNHSLFWSEELARYCLVWISFLGASVAYHDRAHPGVNLLFSRLTPAMERRLAVTVHLISLGLFSTMVIHGFKFAYFVRLQITPALAMPKWIVMGILPVSGAVFMVHGACFLINEIRGKDR